MGVIKTKKKKKGSEPHGEKKRPLREGKPT